MSRVVDVVVGKVITPRGLSEEESAFSSCLSWEAVGRGLLGFDLASIVDCAVVISVEEFVAFLVDADG